MTGAAAFIRTHTTLCSPALVPEILLHTASEITPIWHATEAWLSARNIAPPFWAFAWPGGQAAARHILDHPGLVAGRHVLDFAAGSGIAAIAAARAGAASVEAVDIDPLACAAIRLNALANAVEFSVEASDLVGSPSRWDLILCGDVCYEAGMASRVISWLRDVVGSAEVWIADPGRAYLPKLGLVRFASYTAPTSRELEDRPEREVGLFRVQP